MRERLFLYIDRDSPLHRLNPFTKLVLTFALILIAFLGPGLFGHSHLHFDSHTFKLLGSYMA